MPFVTTAIYGAGILQDDEMIIFREYENIDTSKKYIKVMYTSDYENFNNVFHDNNQMPFYLNSIYNYCTHTSCTIYSEEHKMHVLTGHVLLKKTNRAKTLMVSPNNFVGSVVDKIYSDTTRNISHIAKDFYEETYSTLMKHKYNIVST
jgi:hypothetical protein